MQGRLLLDVVVGQCAAVLELLAREDEALLVGRDALLVLYLGLDALDGVVRLDVQGNGFTSQRLDEDLHVPCYSNSRCFSLCDTLICTANPPAPGPVPMSTRLSGLQLQSHVSMAAILVRQGTNETRDTGTRAVGTSAVTAGSGTCAADTGAGTWVDGAYPAGTGASTRAATAGAVGGDAEARWKALYPEIAPPQYQLRELARLSGQEPRFEYMRRDGVGWAECPFMGFVQAALDATGHAGRGGPTVAIRRTAAVAHLPCRSCAAQPLLERLWEQTGADMPGEQEDYACECGAVHRIRIEEADDY